MQRVKSALYIVGFGALGMALMLGLYVVGAHLWQDHANLHALVNIEYQREQAMGPAKAAPAPSKP
jgi:hypothetical protein